MRSLIFLFSIIFSQSLWAQRQCDLRTDQGQALAAVVRNQCEQMKQSPQCQDLYKTVQANGGVVSEKALRCEVDSHLTLAERMSVSYIACLRGGIEDGLIAPVQQLGKWIGESAANVVIAMQKSSERKKYCDQHPELKPKIYATYNQSVPKLLQVNVPKNFKNKNCAQIEVDLYRAQNQKLRQVSERTDHKRHFKKEAITPDEQEYLDWKFNKNKFAEKSDLSLMAMADQALEQYGVRIDCYNLEARVALRCEALFNIATLGLGGGKLALSALSGLKAERFAVQAKTLSNTSDEFADYAKAAEKSEVGGSVIGPGVGPVDLARLERRVRFHSREIELAEANGGKLAPLLEKRSKVFSESGEFMAMGKNYSAATKEFELAAQDVKRALEQGGLKSSQEQLQAMRILENAGSEKYVKTYQKLAAQIARSPETPFPPPVQNPVVLQQQKGSVWEAVREYREQRIRIEILRAQKDKNSREKLAAMLQRKEQLRHQVEERIKKDQGAAGPHHLQKVLNQLGM